MYRRDQADTTSYSSSEDLVVPSGYVYIYRHDQSLSTPIRVLPTSRKVSSSLPGCIVGQYRWRSSSNKNANAIVSTNWNIDTSSIGLEKFIAGYGDKDDLAPNELVQDGDSIRLVVNSGEYFTGVNRYYLPATPVVEFFKLWPLNIQLRNGFVKVISYSGILCVISPKYKPPCCLIS